MSYRIGQRIRIDGWLEGVVCDVREDGTAYSTTQRENERIKVCDKGVNIRRIETQVPGRCKCLAQTYMEHLDLVNSGIAAPHVYSGFAWLSENDEEGSN